MTSSAVSAGASFVLLSLAYACVGAVVAARVPENPIGWIFCATGLAFGLATLSYEYARFGLYATAQSLLGASLAAALPTETIAALLGLTVLLLTAGCLRVAGVWPPRHCCSPWRCSRPPMCFVPAGSTSRSRRCSIRSAFQVGAGRWMS